MELRHTACGDGMIKHKNPGVIDAIFKRQQEVAKKEVAVGYPKGKAQAYPDGESVIDVAAKNCFGIGVPVRDFMALAKIYIADDQTIKDLMVAIAKETSSKDWSPEVVAKLQEAAGL